MKPDADQREQLLARLHRLRTVIRVLAQEHASAPRQSTRMRMESGRLVEEVQRLQRRRRLPREL